MIYLGFIDFLKDKILNWGNLVAFLIGIGIGFILTLLLYLLVVVTSVKKEESKIKKTVIKVDDSIINNIIINEKNRYKLEAKSLPASQKIVELRNSCSNLIIDIARTYYPDSHHPVFEITVDELIKLDYYIMEKIETIFSRRLFKKIRSLKLVSIMNFVDRTKKVAENKVVKNTVKSTSKVWKVINAINPVYWGKKVFSDIPISMITNKIALVIIDIVGNETSKVYSKSVFVADDDYLEKELNELDIEEEESDV